jgi:uncharacterized iron-regulated protein
MIWFLVALLGSAQQLPPGHPQTGAPPSSGYVPHRVYDSREKRFTDFESLLSDLARAEVVFVGEQHDDPATHRLELAVLEGLLRRGRQVTVALEMFERDVQPALDGYLAGRTAEEEFLKVSRPWPRYQSDYRPIVEFARIHGWPVVAGNVPRRLAAAVAKTGLAALDALPPEERAFAASELRCPFDDYFDRFAEQMNSHPGGTPQTPAEQKASLERFYFSQCIKDETMAESVAMRVQGENPPVVVHYNGAFHSDFGHGAAERTRRRLSRSRVTIVSMMPVESLDGVEVSKDERKRADYLVFTQKPVHKR